MKNAVIVITFSLLIKNMNFTQPNQIATGREVYEKNCTKCHGKDGSKKAFGVKSLQKSLLSNAEKLEIITNGKGKMPSWKDNLSVQEINQVAQYIDTLSKN